jgi:hypothetical protein
MSRPVTGVATPMQWQKINMSKDYLGLGDNPQFLACLAHCKEKASGGSFNRFNMRSSVGSVSDAEYQDVEEEKIAFADIVMKINRRKARQRRVLVVTNVAIYNFEWKKYKTYKRRIALVKLTQIFTIKSDPELFVLHSDAVDEYDYRFESPKKDEILDILRKKCNAIGCENLHVIELEEAHIEAVMVSKKQRNELLKQVSLRGGQNLGWDQSSTIESINRATMEDLRTGPIVSAAGAFDARSIRADTTVTVDDDRARGSSMVQVTSGNCETHTQSSETPRDICQGTSMQSLLSNGDDMQSGGEDADQSEGEEELPIQLKEIYDILLEIKSKSENSRVHEIMSWPSKKPSQMIKMVVEILCDDDSAQDILWWCASVPVWARSFIEGIATLVGEKQEVIRVWALRALWRLIPLFEAEQLMQDHLLPMGGFVEMSLTALSRYPLTKPLYVALLELMLNQKSQTGHIEAMGQAIAKKGGQICEVVMKLLRDCNWDLRLEILKDINVLMIRREENVQVFLEAHEWQLWLFHILEHIPRRQSERTEVEEQVFKCTMNVFCIVHLNVFSKYTDKLEPLLNQSLDMLHKHAGWGYDAVGVGRTLLTSLISKIAKNMSR